MKGKPVVNGKKVRKRKRAMNRRTRKVQFLFSSCPPVETLETSPDPRKLPIGQLITAANQFILGYFENCVLNSAFAVEYGFLLKINAELSEEQKQSIAKTRRGGFGLPDALNMSRGKWIDEALYSQLNDLKNLRDMSAHPSNWVTLYNQLIKLFAEDERAIKEWIQKSTSRSYKQIADRLKDEFDVEKARKTQESMISYAEKRWGSLPDLEWATRKGTLNFQIDFVKRHSQPMVREMLNQKKIIDMIGKPDAAPRYMLNRYNFPEEIAMKALRIAYDALCQLKII